MANIGVTSSITRLGKNEPFGLQVSRGQITGHQRVAIYGYSAAVANTAYGPLWEGLTQSGGLYVFPSSAVQMSIVSSSTSDDTTKSVVVQGLDANWAPITEVIALNGTSAVTTVNSFLRINFAAIINGTNIGAITVSNGGTTYAKITATLGLTQASVYSVPAGYSLYGMYITKTASIGFTSSTYMLTQLSYTDNISGATGVINEQTYVQQLVQDQSNLPVLIPQKTDCQWTFKTSSGGPLTASFQYVGILVQNNIQGT